MQDCQGAAQLTRAALRFTDDMQIKGKVLGVASTLIAASRAPRKTPIVSTRRAVLRRDTAIMGSRLRL